MEREHDPIGIATVGVFLRRFFGTERGLALGRIALTRAILREPRFLYQPPAAPVAYGRIGIPVPEDIWETIRHVADWIEADMLRDAHWLSRTDAEGRPLKLAKIVSLAQARNEADKAMRRYLSSLAASEPGTDETVELDLGEGWTLVRLTTVEALDRESASMGHCIGGGSYDKALLSGASVFLSLRDRRGRSHATIQLDPRPGPGLVQLQGRGNARIADRHLLRLLPWIEGHAFFDTDRLADPGFDPRLAVDVEQRVRLRSRLPPVFLEPTFDARHFDGSYGRSHSIVLTVREGTSLPAPIDGPYDVRVMADVWSVAMPSRIVCPELEIRSSRVEFPPDCLIEVADMALKNAEIVGLPDGLHLQGSLLLTGARIGRLPDRLVVENNLDVSGSDVVELPRDLEVGTLTVDGMVVVASSWSGTFRPHEVVRHDGVRWVLRPHAEAGTDVVVKCGDEDFAVPDGFRTSGLIVVETNGSVSTGRDAVVAGDLHLSARSVSLARGLRVEGNLIIAGCAEVLLPEGLFVGGDLRILRRAPDPEYGHVLRGGEEAVVTAAGNFHIVGHVQTLGVPPYDIAKTGTIGGRFEDLMNRGRHRRRRGGHEGIEAVFATGGRDAYAALPDDRSAY